ncbi:MAG TPA: hypothetical protein VIQ30_27155 [Pseudonocardia sp.]|jgi:hypothetical protein
MSGPGDGGTPPPVRPSPGSAGGQIIRRLDLTGDDPDSAHPLGAGVQRQGAHSVDQTREYLAYSVVGLLALLTLGSTTWVLIWPANEPAIEAILKIVFTPVIGLVGSVVGFYFGAQTKKDPPNS